MPRCSIAHAVWLGVAAGCRAHSAEAYVALQQTDGAARGAALRCTSIPQPRLGWAGLGWAGLARTVGVTELPTDRQTVCTALQEGAESLCADCLLVLAHCKEDGLAVEQSLREAFLL